MIFAEILWWSNAQLFISKFWPTFPKIRSKNIDLFWLLMSFFEVNFVNKYKFIHWECFQTFVWRLIKQQIVGMQRNQRDHFFYNINLKNIRVSSHRMQSRFYFSKLFNISWDHIQYILLSDNGISQRLRRLFSFLINFNQSQWIECNKSDVHRFKYV